MENTNNMLLKAKEYLRSGASVMPVRKDKSPCLETWKFLQERHPTEQELEQWWAKWPDANIGVITGKISGITVVDVDKGGDMSQFPTTDTVRTGGGGYHLYYQYCEGYRNKGRILPNIDVRGDGGMVVAPPSVHESGKQYEVINSVGKAPFPIHLFGGERAKTDWEVVMAGSQEGSRNNDATKVCGKLMRTFAPSEWEAVVWPMMKDWNNKSDKPMAEREVRTIFKSVARLARYERNPIELQDTPPLTLTDVIDLGMAELDQTRPEDVVSFGYDFLDEQLTGIFKGELVVVGGETGTGKTTFVTNMVMKASKKHKVMIFALEDRLQDYGIKAIYFEMGRIRSKQGKKNYSWNDYRKNNIQDKEYRATREQARTDLSNGNVLFEDCPTLFDLELLEKIIEKRASEGVELFVVDHLHYFDLLKGDKSKADYIEYAMVSIKKLLVRTGARVIMVVHYRKLNGQKPSIDSFKDSISIGQNANYVINLWRDRAENALRGSETKIMIPKARNPNGEATITAIFNPETNDISYYSSAFGVENANSQVQAKIYNL